MERPLLDVANGFVDYCELGCSLVGGSCNWRYAFVYVIAKLPSCACFVHVSLYEVQDRKIILE